MGFSGRRMDRLFLQSVKAVDRIWVDNYFIYLFCFGVSKAWFQQVRRKRVNDDIFALEVQMRW